jgi:hypothetical protein
MMDPPQDHVGMNTATTAITLRSASAADHAGLADLASLDSRRLRDGAYLIAEDGDQIVAGISERDGSVIADPFRSTTSAVELLRRRREQLLVARNRTHTHARRTRPRLFARHTAGRVA